MSNPSSTLPSWADMSDLDKGAALMHLHKRQWEGASYAVEHYPVRYFDDVELMRLGSDDACRHAASQRGEADALSAAEYERLYELAFAEGEASDEH